MRIRRLPILETANLLVWLTLLALQSAGVQLGGVASIYLPTSLTLLLIRQLALTRPAFDLSIVFLTSCLFFFSIGLILWPFSTISPREFSSLVIETFTWEQLGSAAIWVGLSIAITMATMMTLKTSSGRYPKSITLEYLGLDGNRHESLYKTGVFCIIFSLPAVILAMVEQLRFIQDAGYLALYMDGAPVSVTSKVFLYIFDLGFGLILAFAKTRSQFLIPAILFLIVATIDSLAGARGALLVPLLFIAWYYVSRFNIRVRLFTVFRNLAIVVVAFAFMTLQRNPDLLNGGVLQFGVDALATQGRSLQITALYQANAEAVSQYGNYTVFSNLLIPFIAIAHPEIRETAQSMNHVLYSNNLKHILTYVLNDGYYFAGGGTGGVYTIELLESGPFLYVLLSVVLGWFFVWMPAAMCKPWVRYLSIYFFATVFYMPRGELFFNTLIVGKAMFLYVVVVCLYSILKWCRRSMTNPS